jgi:hypothetical protein
MIWSGRSADSDGSLNGGRRSDSHQGRAPGAEANPTMTWRKSHNSRPAVFRSSLGYPSTTILRFILTTSSGTKLNRYLFRSRSRTHDPRPQHTPHSALRYSIHIRNISVPHFWPSALHSFRILRLLFNTTLLTRFRTFIRFDTLRLAPHASSTRRNPNTLAHPPLSTHRPSCCSVQYHATFYARQSNFLGDCSVPPIFLENSARCSLEALTPFFNSHVLVYHSSAAARFPFSR